jgi:hypothetical protein
MAHDCDAFISYTRQQGAPVVERIFAFLKKERLTVWQDRSRECSVPLSPSSGAPITLSDSWSFGLLSIFRFSVDRSASHNGEQCGN